MQQPEFDREGIQSQTSFIIFYLICVTFIAAVTPDAFPICNYD